MAEDTTTEQPVEPQAGAEPAQPVEPTTPEPAAEAPTEPSEATQDDQPAEEPQQDASNVDDKLRTFAKAQGLDLDSPSAIKAASIAMKAQSEATRNYHRASELEKSMTGISDEVAEQVAQQTNQDPEVLKRLQRMEVKENVRDFWNTPLANGQLPDRQLEQAMIQEVQAKPYLANDLSSLYKSVAFDNMGTVKTQGGREALEKLAHNQQAAVPTGHATNGTATPGKKAFNELSISEMEKRLGFVRN